MPKSELVVNSSGNLINAVRPEQSKLKPQKTSRSVNTKKGNDKMPSFAKNIIVPLENSKKIN